MWGRKGRSWWDGHACNFTAYQPMMNSDGTSFSSLITSLLEVISSRALQRIEASDCIVGFVSQGLVEKGKPGLV